MKIENENFVSKCEQICLQIPITSTLETPEIERVNEDHNFYNAKINIASLHPQEKGEIISASKVSIYSQCPLKYLLTYEYGFGKFNSDYLNFKFADKQQLRKHYSGSDIISFRI